MVSLHKNLKCVEPENNMVPEGMSIPDQYSIHCDHIALSILQKAICGILKRCIQATWQGFGSSSAVGVLFVNRTQKLLHIR